jgi:UDP-N-acetylmuramoyl-L-alanyl-D-glutamate--2,6-diaminopimelate ligase
MSLADLIRESPVEVASGAPDVVIASVTDDSRRAADGALFVARRGTTAHGDAYIDDAVRRGATAVLSDGPAAARPGVVHLRCADPAAMAARLAERLAGEPSTTLALVGVTGTNGKTTVATLIRHVLTAAGLPCGLIGTVHVDLGPGDAASGPEPAALTTPSACETSALLGRMVARGCRACAMEVSSHALDQGRTSGLRFAGAVFTNLSGDHLDYHGTMDAYAAAKASLFAGLPADGWAVINADDPAASLMARTDADVVFTSVDDPGADCRAAVLDASIDGARVRFTGPWGEFETQLPLPGRHNVANALQAAAVGSRLGLDADALRAALATASAPPGRLEPVSGPDDDCTVLVDYAHTDDALDNVLAALRPLVPADRRLRVVFGCGGDRDRTKRPRMAAAACRWADDVVVTSDNPRTEDPESIVDDVLAGIPASHRDRAVRRTDRDAAIRAAIATADAGDVVVIAGKGHEDYQIVGTTKRPFDDRVVARAALDARAGVGR